MVNYNQVSKDAILLLASLLRILTASSKITSNNETTTAGINEGVKMPGTFPAIDTQNSNNLKTSSRIKLNGWKSKGKRLINIREPNASIIKIDAIGIIKIPAMIPAGCSSPK